MPKTPWHHRDISPLAPPMMSLGWLLNVARRLRAVLLGGPDTSLAAREVSIGQGTTFAANVTIDPVFWWLVTIGENCTFAPDVYVLAHDGSTRKHIGYTKLAPVVIGDDVFVGARAIILPGVTIGDGAVIAAGSVVRSSVPAGSVVGGNPASVICPTSEYLARQEQQLAELPKYSRDFTLKGGITRKQRDQMRNELKGGKGFVK